mmetsp:Transcript_1513/g.5098  ORF Transcript_1513/g.5098 Transcript_1513/m.5098 type:complete len:263 (+) Transcript_1513:1590-2378(+)
MSGSQYESSVRMLFCTLSLPYASNKNRYGKERVGGTQAFTETDHLGLCALALRSGSGLWQWHLCALRPARGAAQSRWRAPPGASAAEDGQRGWPMTPQRSSPVYSFIHRGVRKPAPAYGAEAPSSSSMRSSWLYFASRSDRQGAPVLICPVLRPTARSAMKESSVSPERWDVITPQPAFCAMLTASIASVMEPIWFTLSSSALAALSLTARAILVGFVTVRSSPTICTSFPYFATISDQFSQSSSSKPSSMVTTGKSLMRPP